MKIALFFAALSLTLSCSEHNVQSSNQIVTTTTLVGDWVRQLAPDDIVVINLMGAGTDPHTYKPSFADYQSIRNADYLVLSGLHLEGKMAEAIMALEKDKKVWNMASAIPENKFIKSEGFKDGYDPHYWMDIEMVIMAIEGLEKEMILWFPEQQSRIEQKAKLYKERLLAEQEAMKVLLHKVPEAKRVLITSHDAFNYFSRAYQYEVRSLQGFSTAAEFGIRDVTNLVDFIAERQIPAVFVENIVSSQALDAVVQGCEKRGVKVRIGGNLFTDALGDAQSGADSYIEMMKKNAQTLALALGNPN